MRVLTAPAEVRAASRAWRREGLTVGFVPTMGYLHAGHLSLVDAARAAGADRIIASIFVNPTQFGPGEDLASYPRDEAGDRAKLESRGVDLLFMPATEHIYQEGAETSIALSDLPNHLCGLSRPVHFGGVATVVALLFNITEPDVAVFGQKDFQQLQVIRKMVVDLHFAVSVVGAPIIREPDGLAMSSRNAYLNADERQRATCLSRALRDASARVAAGERNADVLKAVITTHCEAAGGTVDYVAIVNESTLEPVGRLNGPARAAIAVRIGPARLIDNVLLSPDP